MTCSRCHSNVPYSEDWYDKLCPGCADATDGEWYCSICCNSGLFEQMGGSGTDDPQCCGVLCLKEDDVEEVDYTPMPDVPYVQETSNI